MVNNRGPRAFYYINTNERILSTLVFSLFSSWMLAFLFEGQILYALAELYGMVPSGLVFRAITALAAGTLICGLLIKTKKAAKGLFLCSFIFCIAASSAFFFPPSILWTFSIVASSFMAGGCVAVWGFYFKSGTPKNERIKTAADVLIYSNVLMILLNMAAIHLSPRMGLALSMLMLLCAFLFALRLPTDGDTASPAKKEESVSIAKPLAFLSLFIIVITINSGLMYQVINPAFAHHESLTSWYWAIPYLVALYIMRNLSRKTNRTYILYVGITMIGFSFIAFMLLDRSAPSYLVVNTLMLGACGIYDLFWWSILGEMLDLDKNPAKILGIGLSANVLGILLGGLVGNAITAAGVQSPNATLLALAVVCVTLAILPPLHKHLSILLKDHAYLTVLSEMSPAEQEKAMNSFIRLEQLTERESEIAALLLKGKTYKMISCELHVSENTVKTHVKNIYAKLKIQSRTELINIMLGQQTSPPLYL